MLNELREGEKARAMTNPRNKATATATQSSACMNIGFFASSLLIIIILVTYIFENYKIERIVKFLKNCKKDLATTCDHH
jgi:hypothetical protein